MMNFMFLSPDVDSVVDYFNRSFGGSLEVEGSYSSLELNMESLLNNTIRCDKMVIVFKDDSGFNIKREVTCLGKLIEENYFFRINEILVFSENTEYCLEGITIFKSIMDTVGFTNYSTKVYEDGLSTAQVYRDVMGIVPDDYTTTSYTKVYRREVGSESRVGYSPRKSKGSIVKSSEDRYSKYEIYKENMSKTETGRVIVENDVKEIPNINIELEEYKSNIDLIRNINIFTGNGKSGTSILCSKSFIHSQNNCLLLDFSRGLGSLRVVRYLDDNPIVSSGNINFIDNKDLLFSEHLTDELKILNYNNKRGIVDFMKYIISIPNRIKYDKIFIDCDLEDLEPLINLIDQRICKLIFTTDSSSEEFSILERYIRKFDKYNCYLFINQFLDLSEGFTDLDIASIDNFYPKLNIVKGEDLNTGNFDLGIFI